MHDENPDDIGRRLDQIVARLKRERPRVGRSLVKNATRAFLRERGDNLAPPNPVEVRAYLDDLVARRGARTAYALFSHLQVGASYLWGAEATAFFARVLRDARVAKKPGKKADWDHAARSIGRLPPEWHGPLMDLLLRSQRPGLRNRGIVWSATRIHAVAEALARWAAYCEASGVDPAPAGESLEGYAQALVAGERVSRNSAADYLERIVTGYHDIITGTPVPPGADFVVADWKGRRGAPTTKTVAQLVGATAIHDVGLRMIGEARAHPTRSLSVAIKYRDGLLLMLGIALPQRSRALASLEFDRSLRLGPFPRIEVDIAGDALKLRETLKSKTRAQVSLDNPTLWQALADYRQHFRPLFDDGAALFPNQIAPGQALGHKRLSVIVGALTKAEFGIRIPIHRLRDNVATEAADHLENGAGIATGLLGHRDPVTTRHYDHSRGSKAMKAWGSVVARKRGALTGLRLGG